MFDSDSRHLEIRASLESNILLKNEALENGGPPEQATDHQELVYISIPQKLLLSFSYCMFCYFGCKCTTLSK